jgi:hypothetical protein
VAGRQGSRGSRGACTPLPVSHLASRVDVLYLRPVCRGTITITSAVQESLQVPRLVVEDGMGGRCWMEVARLTARQSKGINPGDSAPSSQVAPKDD